MLRHFTTLAVLLALLATPLFASEQTTAALLAWQQGQKALDGDRFDEAIRHFQHSLGLDPSLAQNHLSLAAAHLALGNDSRAVPCMAAYLRARPTHFLVRMPFAEILLRLERDGEAKNQLEQFVADVQNHPRLADNHLINCHTRLMEIGERQGDEYTERLHRGIGLYLLALKRSELGGDTARAVSEEMLCKAAAELTLARLCRPSEARPCWYLHHVWTQLGQRQPADKWLRAAENTVGLTSLTPAESRQLHLNRCIKEMETRRK